MLMVIHALVRNSDLIVTIMPLEVMKRKLAMDPSSEIHTTVLISRETFSEQESQIWHENMDLNSSLIYSEFGIFIYF